MTDYCLFSKVKLYAFTFYKQFVLLVKKNASNRDMYSFSFLFDFFLVIWSCIRTNIKKDSSTRPLLVRCIR